MGLASRFCKFFNVGEFFTVEVHTQTMNFGHRTKHQVLTMKFNKKNKNGGDVDVRHVLKMCLRKKPTAMKNAGIYSADDCVIRKEAVTGGVLEHVLRLNQLVIAGNKVPIKLYFSRKDVEIKVFSNDLRHKTISVNVPIIATKTEIIYCVHRDFKDFGDGSGWLFLDTGQENIRFHENQAIRYLFENLRPDTPLKTINKVIVKKELAMRG